VATFLISLFVLVMQFFWLYIDDLVGKGLDFPTLAYLTAMVAITWVPLALPLALLLSSIMTFGNLGESFEIVAIKAAGIPLLRFMRPLFIVTIFISGIAFLFANNIIPVAQLKLAAVKYDIIVSKPSFDIKEGVFYNKMDGYVIKLGKKDKDDSTIHNVVIYKKTYGLQDNLLIAESGIMRTTPDQKFLEFILKNGWSYEEKGGHQTINTDYTRTSFKVYKKEFDLASFKLNRSEDSMFKYDPKMLSIRQLNTTIDSLHKMEKLFVKRAATDINPYFNFSKFGDSVWQKKDTATIKPYVHIDTSHLVYISYVKPAIGDSNPYFSFSKFVNPVWPKYKANASSERFGFAAFLPDSIISMVYERSAGQINAARGNLGILVDDYNRKAESLRYHEIEWHRKFTLSVACLVLFLIGAPLGSIIRKGGLGTPLVFAIVFFVLFHLLNTFGEKFAKSYELSSFAGMWLSTMILIPIGAFLTYKAMKDSQLFNQEYYYRSFKKLKIFLANFSLSKNKS
jgi:lipopolysaccharide export system permease protein